MATEQAQGKIDLDERCDVFGLGAILCEILTGKPPYAAREPAQALMQAAQGSLRDAQERLAQCGADPALVRLTSECLSPDRDERPRHAGVVSARLSAYLADETERIHKAELEKAAAMATAREERKRRRLTLALAATICAVGLFVSAAAFWLIHHRAREAQEIALRRNQTTQAIRRAMGEAQLASERARHASDGLVDWTEALAAARRAEELLSDNPDDPELGDQVVRLRGEIERAERGARQKADDARMLLALEETRLLKSGVKDDRFDFARADPAYAAAFRDYGIDIRSLNDKRIIDRLMKCQPDMRSIVAAALVDWAISCRDARGRSDPLATRLITIAQRIDTDAWRTRFRDALLRDDRGAIHQLAQTIKLEETTPATLFVLAKELETEQQQAVALELLDKSLVRFPNDFWLNHECGHLQLAMSPPRVDDAVRRHAVAVALRPQSPGARLNLGYALMQRGNYREAAEQTREALRLKPNYADAYNNLGVDLMQLGELGAAVESLRRALEINPNHEMAAVNMSQVMLQRGDLAAAEKYGDLAVKLSPNAYLIQVDFAVSLLNRGLLTKAEQAARLAIKSNPEFANSHFVLGNILAQQRREDEAAKYYREAIRLNPAYAEAHCNLGHSLNALGRFAEAYEEIKRGHELGRQIPGWKYPSDQWVKQTSDLLKSDRRWAEYRDKKTAPARLEELLALASFGFERKRDAAGVIDLFERAIQLSPTLGAGPRNPARSMAIQAAMQLEASKTTNAAARKRSRALALKWLRADLDDWGKANEANRGVAIREIGAILTGVEYQPLRDPQLLARLPAGERDEWVKFWAELRALQSDLTGPQ